MTTKIRVFISSVQKELEHERVALSSLMTTDPFLMQHCVPVLFEKEPIPARPSTKPYLDCLKSCHVYVLLIFNDYGRLDGGLSATHSEYRLAHKLKLPTLVFIKGTADDMRQSETKALINEIKTHKHTYRRFIDREDLKPEVRDTLVALLRREFALKASADGVAAGRELIEAASTFESKPLTDVSWTALDRVQIARFTEAIGASPDERTGKAAGSLMHARGLLWRDD